MGRVDASGRVVERRVRNALPVQSGDLSQGRLVRGESRGRCPDEGAEAGVGEEGAVDVGFVWWGDEVGEDVGVASEGGVEGGE